MRRRPKVDLLLDGTIVDSYAILGRTSTASGRLTTRGFRDVLEIGHLRTPERYARPGQAGGAAPARP